MENIFNGFESVVSQSRNDLVFEGKNKQYGAYEIRTAYEGTVLKSMVIACSLVFILCMFQNHGTKNIGSIVHNKTIDTISISNAPEKKKAEIKPPKNSSSSSSKGLTIIVSTNTDTFSTDSASIAGIGNGKQGNDTTGILAGLGNGKDSVTLVVKTTFIKSDERDATFEGGESAFYKWFEKKMIYPGSAIDNGSQGRVKIQFHVDVDGSLSNFTVVQDLKEAPELADEVIRVLKMSPKWTPASQNGIKVPAYRIIPIDFVLN